MFFLMLTDIHIALTVTFVFGVVCLILFCVFQNRVKKTLRACYNYDSSAVRVSPTPSPLAAPLSPSSVPLPSSHTPPSRSLVSRRKTGSSKGGSKGSSKGRGEGGKRAAVNKNVVLEDGTENEEDIPLDALYQDGELVSMHVDTSVSTHVDTSVSTSVRKYQPLLSIAWALLHNQENLSEGFFPSDVENMLASFDVTEATDLAQCEQGTELVLS